MNVSGYPTLSHGETRAKAIKHLSVAKHTRRAAETHRQWVMQINVAEVLLRWIESGVIIIHFVKNKMLFIFSSVL